MNENGKLRWGILGTGFIADAFATGLGASRTGVLAAVGSRTRETAERFAAAREEAPERPRAYGGYGDVLADGSVDAVYIATPHPFHHEWAVKSAAAGKAVLCEKPLGMDPREAEAIVAAARGHGVFLMEAYMYRLAPQTRRLIDLVADGVVGELRTIEASFSFEAPADPESRLFNKALGGGGILDVGGYPLTMAQLMAGVATGGHFAVPEWQHGTGTVGETGVDEYATGTCLFPEEITARMTCGIGVEEPRTLRLEGTGGSIEVPNPWVPAKHGGTSEIRITRGTTTEIDVVTSDSFLYALEADAVADALPAQQAAWPAMSWDETLATARLQRRWLEAVRSNGGGHQH